METTKSYRIRTTPSGGENYKLNISFNQDYDFIDILSLKLNQKNLYTSPVANYGCIIGRVIANGGVGVPNAHVSIFISANEKTRRDILKNFLYPYDNPNDKNSKKIKFNLLKDRNESINECYQVVGSLPSKRVILDNNDILEIFDEYYKYSTVTNSHGDYMLFGVPTGNCQIHCDVDISDCGILSQKPRDMFYKGYSTEQFESSTQFKKDTNLNNLAQIFTEDSSVFVYPFWGDETENEVGVTRYDINISYKFETTCVFLGCCITDSDNATVYPTCMAQKNTGALGEMTSKMGTIEMIRVEPNGGIVNVKIKGNQLIDGNGVWCYQIPMNLDYITTDEFGNEIVSDNQEIGIATRTDVRFKIKLEGGDDNKIKACHLVPHNPESYHLGTEVSYKLDADTPKNQFVSLFKNNVYSVKSYIPRLQNSSSSKNTNFIGIKFIEKFGTNTPFPYNDMSSRLPVGFIILCIIALTMIMFINMLNVIYRTISCISCKIQIGWWSIDLCAPIGKLFCGMFRCISINPDWCPYQNIIVFPGCTPCDNICPFLTTAMNNDANATGTNPKLSQNRNLIENCVITALADDMGVSSFHFTNDWINGCLYFPTFNYKKKRKKRRRFLGLFGKYKVRVYEEVCSFEEENYLSLVGSNFHKKGVYKHRIFKACAPSFNTNEINYMKHAPLMSHTDYDKCIDHMFNAAISQQSDLRNKVDRNSCLLETSYYEHREPFVNRESIGKDNNDEEIYEYYYRPITRETGNTGIYGNLFKTDVILIGTLDDCNKDGIWQLHNELPITTFQMPGEMYEIDYADPEDEEPTDESGDELPVGDQMFVASGKNWGYRGGTTNLPIFEPHVPGGNYRFNSRNNSGGLFFGVGCTRFETKMKTCANLNRICQLGVDLDVAMARDDRCDGQEMYAPQGFIGKDQLIKGYEVRQKFATLNHNRLNTYDVVVGGRLPDGTLTSLPNGTLLPKLIFNNGRRYYNFKYLYPNNFDSMLALSFKGTNGGLNNLISPEKSKFNTENESYIDKDYFNFIYGTDRVSDKIALVRKRGENIPGGRGKAGATGVSFFQSKNSFYFYFGLKSGSTAIEIFRQKYFSTCFQETDDVGQMQITVLQHPYICSCIPGFIPPTIISINIINVPSGFSIYIEDENRNKIIPPDYISTWGIMGFEAKDTRLTFYSHDKPPGKTHILVPQLANPGVYSFILMDDYKNMIYNYVTLIPQNRVSFRLEQKTHIYGDIDVDCRTSLMTERSGELRAKVVLKNILNIKNKGCKLENYELVVTRINKNIGSGAQFRIRNNPNANGSIGNGVNTINGTGVGGHVEIVNGGTKYITGAVARLGDGGAYIKVMRTNPPTGGAIVDFLLVNEKYEIDPLNNYGTGYTASDRGVIMLVENMIHYEQPIIEVIKQDYIHQYDGCPPTCSSHTPRYPLKSEDEVRDWEGFAIYLCLGEYSVCLRDKRTTPPPLTGCYLKDENCDYITIEKRPPIELVFSTRIKAALFKEILHTDGNRYNPNINVNSGGDSNVWWEQFFLCLRKTRGKSEVELLNDLSRFYGPDPNITVENIQEYIDILRLVFMPLCRDSVLTISLGGEGFSVPFRTLLYGRNTRTNMCQIPVPLNNNAYLLTANDAYNRVRHTSNSNGVDIPYQTQESMFVGLLNSFLVDTDSGQVSLPITNINQNLTPRGAVFTTSTIPIPPNPNVTVKLMGGTDITYYAGGYYAGVIGMGGLGNAAGYTPALTTIVKDIRAGDVDHAVTVWEVKNRLSSMPNGFISNANQFLFKFHILDQTLKVFSEWNRISAGYRDYYEPDECDIRYIPPYIDIFYINGPPETDLTASIDNSPFDVVGAGIFDGVNLIIPDDDNQDENIELEEDFMPSIVTDDVYHLGTCPSRIPNARHFYSTSRFYMGEGGSIIIEQRTITKDANGEEKIKIDCEDKVVEEFDLNISNTNIKVSSYINCNTNSVHTVENHYSHGLFIKDFLLNIILNPDLKKYDLYEIVYSKNSTTAHCHGYGATLKWTTENGGVTVNFFISIFSFRRRTKAGTPSIGNLRILTPGNGYKPGETYTINNGGGVVLVTVTGQVREIIITNGGEYTSNVPPRVTISNPPSGWNFTENSQILATAATAQVLQTEMVRFNKEFTKPDGTIDVVDRWRVSRVRITSAGNGYTSSPTITFDTTYTLQFISGSWVNVPTGGVITSSDSGGNGFHASAISVIGGGPNGEIISFSVNTLNEYEWDKGAQLLRTTVTKGRLRIWQYRTPKTVYDWGTDLYCNNQQRTSSGGISSNTPEDILYYVTSDTWANRYNYPSYTKRNADTYAGIGVQPPNPPLAEPIVNCVGDTVGDYTSGTSFSRHKYIDAIMRDENGNNTTPKTTLATIFLPFSGNVVVPLNYVIGDTDNTKTIIYKIIHDNDSGIRAFSQPMDFGNYVHIDENLIEFVPNYLTGSYTINMTVEIRGRLAHSCHGYKYKIEEGNYDIEFGSGEVNTTLLQGWELIDTKVNTTKVGGNTIGSFINGKKIRFQPTMTYEFGGFQKTTIMRPTGLRFTCTDKEKIIRVSVTDVSGVENYTYISLFRWIDNDEQLTYCLYRCNRDIMIELNTGFVIDFEWKDKITEYVGIPMVYLTKTMVFPEDSTNPEPIIMQGKNLIRTNRYSPNTGGTVLSDGTTLEFDYRGEIYLWFNPNDDHSIDKSLSDSINPIVLDVVASSCFISYKVLFG